MFEILDLYNQAAGVLDHYGQLHHHEDMLTVKIELSKLTKRPNYIIHFGSDIHLEGYYSDVLLQQLKKEAFELQNKTVGQIKK